MTLGEAASVLAQIDYKGWKFKLEVGRGSYDMADLMLGIQTTPVLDAYGSGTETPLQSLQFIPPLDHIADEKDFARHVRRAIREVEQHEADEWFKLKGKRIFNPHKGWKK